MKPTISIIMPFYNRADLLSETIDSILAQTYTEFELIGVDDGSTDNASEIFKNYAKHDNRLKLCTKPHTNAGDARNLGYQHSTGKYLIFLDSDDPVEPDFLATMLFAIQKEQSDIAICIADEFDHNTKKQTRVREINHIKLSQPVTTFTQKELQPNIFTIMLPAVWNRIFKRELIEQYHLHFQSQRSSNDMFFSFSALIYAKKITFVNRILVHHRTNDQRSLSNLNNPDIDKFDICSALDYLREQLPSKKFNLIADKYYEFYFQKTMEGIMRSNFTQGQRIFAHSRTLVLEKIKPNFSEQQTDKIQLLSAMKNNDFVSLYRWLQENKLLLVNDLSAETNIKKFQQNSSIKIAFLIYHLSDGGAERAVTLWSKILVDNFYNVTIITYYPRTNEYKIDPRITRVNFFNSYQDYLETVNKNAVCKKLLEQYLANHPQDILIPFLSDCNLLATLCCHDNLKVVTQTIRNSPWDKEHGFKLIMRDWAIQKQGSVILQNNEQAEYFKQPLFQHVKKYIVHNPLNPEILNIKKEYYKSIKKIIASGRLVPQKNHTLMIEAIRILRDEYHENYCLDIYGNGDLKDTLQAQIDQHHLNDQVKLCGRSTNIFHVTTNYDLFLIASAYEGTPNVLLEAMGLGVPSLAVKCRTGIVELINDNKNGYIVNSYDPHVIAEKIHSINNAQKLQQIGIQARQDMISRYTTDKVQIELMRAIEDLLTNPPKPHKAILPQCKLQTQDDYQNYFESSLHLIKIVDYDFAKDVFAHAVQNLQNISVKADSDTKQKYYESLQKQQFDEFYQYLQNRKNGNQ